MKKVIAISAIALTLGMGSALAAAPRSAPAPPADFPSRKVPPPVYVPPPPPPLVWNGFYAGLNIGGGWAANKRNKEISGSFSPNFFIGSRVLGVPNLFFLPNGNQTGSASGIVGGAQVGYNFQFNPSIV